MASHVSEVAQIVYPESDGKPMGETGIHVDCTVGLYDMLRHHFRRRGGIYVGNNLFVYYRQGDPRGVVCPDVFVALDVAEGQRRTWKTWEKGKGPDVVFEITSASTRLEDLGNKRVVYADLGVPEYFLFDPLGEWLDPPLQGYRMRGKDFESMTESPLHSEPLGLEVHAGERHLRLYDPREERWLRTYSEEAEAREQAEALLSTESALREAKEAELADARAEIERLREELERRKNG